MVKNNCIQDHCSNLRAMRDNGLTLGRQIGFNPERGMAKQEFIGEGQGQGHGQKRSKRKHPHRAGFLVRHFNMMIPRAVKPGLWDTVVKEKTYLGREF